MGKRIRTDRAKPKNHLEEEDALFERWLDDPAGVEDEFSSDGSDPQTPDLPQAASSADPTSPEPAPDRQLSLEDEILFLQAVREIEPPTPPESDEPITPGRELTSPSKCRRLDLHGHTRRTAAGLLRAFLVEQSRRGESWVLVVTGRGNNSASEPVLLSALPGWLRVDNADVVAEFKPAPIRHGGRGATLVRLRSKTR